MQLSIPEPLVAGFLRLVVKPVLQPPFPIRFQRRWLELTALASRPPGGVVARRTRLGRSDVLTFTAGEGLGPVVLYFHGGGFIVSSPGTHAALCGQLALSLGGVVHAVDYRLAPEHPWPAGREDALDAYDALLHSGVDPARLLLGGDSAGGVMVVDLLRDVLAGDRTLPAGAFLFSAAVGFDRIGSHQARRRDTLVSPRWAKMVDAAYARPVHEPGNRILGEDLTGFPPMHVRYSEGEVFAEDNRRFVAELERADVPVTSREDAGAFHVLPLLPGLMRRAREAVDDVARFAAGVSRPTP